MTQTSPDPVSLINNPRAFYAHIQIDDTEFRDAVLAEDLQTADRIFSEAVVGSFRDVPQPGQIAARRETMGVYTCPADDVVAGRFTILNQTNELGEKFDWNARYGMGDREFVWLLNRFFFLDELWDAWKDTGDRKYIDRAVFLMTDWVETNPVEQADELWAS